PTARAPSLPAPGHIETPAAPAGPASTPTAVSTIASPAPPVRGAFAPSPSSHRGEQAIAEWQEADSLDALPRVSHGDEVVYGLEAMKARARGEALLEPTGPVRVSCGEAITWDNQIGEASRGETAWIIDTLEHPNTVTAGASGRRLSAARGVGVLEPAIDAAQSAQAANSIEKMLCHQLAAVHFTAMRLLLVAPGSSHEFDSRTANAFWQPRFAGLVEPSPYCTPVAFYQSPLTLRIDLQRFVEVVVQPLPRGRALGHQGPLPVEELWGVLPDDAVNDSRFDHQMQELVDGDEPEDDSANTAHTPEIGTGSCETAASAPMSSVA
ncbi:MAG: hypothetical protein NUW01_04905, partial [Gemmatimonadaceae bacterium]|nr:hypothetical protein [Gemmatimonadaceae bacterium]